MTKKTKLGFLRRLIFKAVICCERAELQFNGKIRARGAELEIIDWVAVENSDDRYTYE